MLHRNVKALFYFIFSPIMRVNAWRHRYMVRRRSGPLRLHLGPGQKNYLPGWLILDANMFAARCDMWVDLRYDLSFQNSVAQAVYSPHVIEHLPDLPAHFREVARVLRPGGVYRVGVPNTDAPIRDYLQNEPPWSGDFPDK